MARLVVGAALAITVLVAGMTVAGCTAGCPADLLEGNLMREGPDLVVRESSDHIEPVDRLAAGYSLRLEGDLRVVVDDLGNIKAWEGNFVSLGGG